VKKKKKISYNAIIKNTKLTDFKEEAK